MTCVVCACAVCEVSVMCGVGAQCDVCSLCCVCLNTAIPATQGMCLQRMHVHCAIVPELKLPAHQASA